MTKPGVVVTWRGGTTKEWEPDGIESRSLRLAKQRGITQREAVRIIEQQDMMDEAMGPRKNPLHPMFRDHNCAYCGSGERPCKQGSPNRCEYPHARND